MSVGIHDSDTFVVPIEELAAGQTVAGTVHIVSVSPQCIIANYKGHELTVNFGEAVSSKESGSGNPYLSYEGFSVRLEYADLTDFNHTLEIIQDVSEYHRRLNAIGQFALPAKIVEEQNEVRRNLSQLCNSDISLYPLYALLMACENWTTFEIVRMKQFKKILLKGIEKGCLLHDVDYAWQTMELAATNNDPTGFMDDMERYYDIIAACAEHGNTIALDIMNQIWEPEQIIEED